MARHRLGTDPLTDLAPAGDDAGAAPSEAAAPSPRRRAASRRSAKPAAAARPARPARTPARSAPAAPAAGPEPSASARPLTTLEERFDETLKDFEERLGKEAGLEAGTRRRLEEEIRHFGARMADRLEALRSGEDRDRAAMAVARSLLHLDTLVRLATRRWLAGKSLVVDAFGYDPVGAGRWEPLARFLVEKYFRVEARGIEAIPAQGPAILVANHAGAIPFDGLVVSVTVRQHHPQHRDVRWLAENEAHHFPFFGTVMARLGAVRACPENAKLLLDRGSVVAVFPEGNVGLRKAYRERYRLRRFGRGGAVKLALRQRVPVIPVALVGGEETYPLLGQTTLFTEALGVPFLPLTPLFPWLGPLGLLPLPVRWRLQFGAPMTFDLPPSAADDPATVNRLNERIRGEVQGMLSDLLARRRAVFW